MLRQALQFQIKGIGKQRGITAGGGGGFFRLPAGDAVGSLKADSGFMGLIGKVFTGLCGGA